MAEKLLRVQSRNHQETQEVQAGDLEEVALEVQVEVLAEAPEEVVLDSQVDQGEEVLAAAVVAAVAAAVEETLQETLRETPTEAENITVRGMMTTLRMTQTRSPSQILREEGAHDRSSVNPVVAKAAKVAKVASSPERGTGSTLDLSWLTTRRTHQWMIHCQCSTSTERRREWSSVILL